ncbi:hypothetical protein AUK40_00940 [Candidatus Wirthbacteria bacterium CG2_30_54_11]|uniref:Uncharacterized protein n=1 Tax=Candidatus Wirthbacteria bacterium CG2_30_54_11 TaxID=1817892 RepID=A0A1J5IPX9_9BACT|nr:MAG: hypothetical protein AUK40_00940 [Candidatus Wirthbacteria bacterium CG2_30_54_11]
MRAWLRRLGRKKIVMIILSVILLGIVSLEILSRICPVRPRGNLSCAVLIARYVPSGMLSQYGYSNRMFMPDGSVDSAAEVLKDRVFEVDGRDIAGLNGIACGSYAFVSRSLPQEARKYVALHEAYHVAGMTSETAVNYKAGANEPLGMVMTVIYSLWYGASHTAPWDYPCLCGGDWRLLKTYFMGMGRG